MIDDNNFKMLTVLDEKSAINISREMLPFELAQKLKIADPSVFSILKTTNDIIQSVNLPWSSLADSIGMIVMGNAYPKMFTQKVIQEMRTTNRVSPLSFINANAGSAISICCTIYKFQGPTINLTIGEPYREEIALVLAKQWLLNKNATYIFMITSDVTLDEHYVVSNKLLGLK